MQNTSQGSENKSYRVILFLFVGLVAFSSAMKEFKQIHQLTQQTSALVARWSHSIAPVEHYAILGQAQTCERTKILVPPAPPLPAPAVPAFELQAPEIPAPALVPPTPPRAPVVPAAKPRREVRPSNDDAEVRVLLSTDDLVEKSLRDALEANATLKALKAKNRRPQIFITPDGKDVILKSLNRSINLRSAS
jgi:hypothetical protein